MSHADDHMSHTPAAKAASEREVQGEGGGRVAEGDMTRDWLVEALLLPAARGDMQSAAAAAVDAVWVLEGVGGAGEGTSIIVTVFE